MSELALKKIDAHAWEREKNEHYVEPHWCSERLFEVEDFKPGVWDPWQRAVFVFTEPEKPMTSQTYEKTSSLDHASESVNETRTCASIGTQLTQRRSPFDRDMRDLQSLIKRSPGNADLQTVAGTAVEQLRTLGGMDPEADPVRYGWVKKQLARSVTLIGILASNPKS